MIRGIGLLLVVCCGAGAGWFCAMRLRQSRRAVEQLCQMLGELSVQMAFRSLPVYELLAQLAQAPAYAMFSFPAQVLYALEQGEPLCAAWEKAVQSDSALPEEAKRILCPLGSQLGASDLEGQLETLAQYKRQVESYARETQQKWVQRQRLYGSLGLLGGLMAAILLS